MIVRGRRNATDRIRHLLLSAQRHVLVHTTANGLLRLAQDHDDLAAAHERGADLHILAPDDDRSRSAARALAGAADVQHAATPPDVTLVVVDHARALLHRAHPDDTKLFRGDDLAVVIEDAVLARALEEMATPRAAPMQAVPNATDEKRQEGSATRASHDA